MVSFVIVARFWMIHHSVTVALERCQHLTLVANLALLGLCSLVPFASAVLGTHPHDPVSVWVFSGVLGTSGLGLGLLTRHVAKSPRLHLPDHGISLEHHWRYNTLALPAVALVSSLAAAVHNHLAVALWALEPLLALGVSSYATRVRPPG